MKRGPPEGVALGKTPDADLPGCHADDEGENDRSLIRTPTGPLNQASAVRPSFISYK